MKSFNSGETFIWSRVPCILKVFVKKEKTGLLKWVMANSKFEQTEIFDFHKNAGKGDAWNDFVMDRNGLVKTVSITSIEKSDLGIEMIYEDLLTEKGALSTLS